MYLVKITVLLQLDSGRMYLDRLHFGRVTFCYNWNQA
jgi:hypothetical protein